MKQFLIFIISALFVVGCANNPPQKAENPVQPELFPDLKKFPVQKISIECTVPAPSRIRNLMDLFNGGFIHIENVYLSVDQKEVWVVAQLEVENLQAPEEIATGTVSSSVPVRAPNVPIKYYILSKKHWDAYGKFNKDRPYIYLGSKGLVVLPNGEPFCVEEGVGNVLVPVPSTILYPRSE